MHYIFLCEFYHCKQISRSALIKSFWKVLKWSYIAKDVKCQDLWWSPSVLAILYCWLLFCVEQTYGKYRCLGTMAILDLISIYFNQKPVVLSKFPSSCNSTNYETLWRQYFLLEILLSNFRLFIPGQENYILILALKIAIFVFFSSPE